MVSSDTGGRGPEYIPGDGGGGGGGRLLARIPRRLVRWAVLVLIVLAIPLTLFRSFFVYIEPNEFGIKEVKIGVQRGIQEKVYTAGYVFVKPFGFERMHRFPRSRQVLELTGFPQGAKAGAYRVYEPAAKIQTSDGYYVDVDISIIYRITEPFVVMKTLGPGRRYLDNAMLPKTEPIMKQAFGQLTTEDFYNAPLRVEKARVARDQLSKELAANGIEVEHVLVRYFKYSDKLQKNIEEKKLQDQLVFKNQAEARAAAEEINLKRVVEEGEADVRVTLEEGQAYKVRIDAERELYVRKKRAEADLMVKLADAKAAEMRNEAMQVIGADRKVAMEMAEVLRGLDAVLIPAGGDQGMNPLDLDNLLLLFGVDLNATAASSAIEEPSFLIEPSQEPAPLPEIPEALPVPELEAAETAEPSEEPPPPPLDEAPMEQPTPAPETEEAVQ